MRKATITLYKDRAGAHRWRLTSPNGNIIAESGQGYRSAQSRDKGLLAVKNAFRPEHAIIETKEGNKICSGSDLTKDSENSK